MMHRFLVGLILVWFLYGCSSPANNQPALELDLAPKILEVEVNSSGNLTVKLNRKNLSSSLPIKLELENPPASLIAPSVTVTNSPITFKLTPNSEGTYNLKLKASAGTITKTAEFTLMVKKP